jgi:hypothetical protein
MQPNILRAGGNRFATNAIFKNTEFFPILKQMTPVISGQSRGLTINLESVSLIIVPNFFMPDNSQDLWAKVSKHTIVAVTIQIILGLCLLASTKVTSNTPLSAIPMGICIVLILINLGVYFILFCYFFQKGNLYGRPLLVIFVFWLLVVVVPFAYYQVKEKNVTVKRDKRTQTIENVTAEGFKNYVEPLLRKKYNNVVWIEEKRCFEIRHDRDTFFVSYKAVNDELLLNVSQKVYTIPSEFDTVFWLGKANLIRPIMSDDDKKRLDSLQNVRTFRITKIGNRNPSGPLGSKEIRIVNNSLYKPEGPLEIDAFFNCGKHFLWIRYSQSQILLLLKTPVKIQLE